MRLGFFKNLKGEDWRWNKLDREDNRLDWPLAWLPLLRDRDREDTEWEGWRDRG